MPTASELVPVAEVASCADACAQWLFDEGFTTLPPGSPSIPGDVSFAIDYSKAYEHPPGTPVRAVIEAFYWLWRSALPAIDGRRANAREDVASSSSGGQHNQVNGKGTDPDEFADLYYGTAEHDLAGRIRNVVAKAAALEKLIKEVAARYSRRAISKGDVGGDDITSAFRKWRGAGESLQHLVEPTGGGGIEAMLVPHTLKDWQQCRLELELYFHSAGLTDSQITRLLPGSGMIRDVYHRRYQVRRQYGVPLQAYDCEDEDGDSENVSWMPTGGAVLAPVPLELPVSTSWSCAQTLFRAASLSGAQVLSWGYP